MDNLVGGLRLAIGLGVFHEAGGMADSLFLEEFFDLAVGELPIVIGNYGMRNAKPAYNALPDEVLDLFG